MNEKNTTFALFESVPDESITHMFGLQILFLRSYRADSNPPCIISMCVRIEEDYKQNYRV